MKKLFIILALLLLLCSCVDHVGCLHENKSYVEGEGVLGHWLCFDCGGMYWDEACTMPTNCEETSV